MNYLSFREIKDRVSVLNTWLNRHHKEHYQYAIVRGERDYYENLADEMDDMSINMMDVNCPTQCYEMITREEL